MTLERADTFRLRQKHDWLVGWRLEANCPHVGPGPIEDMPSVGVFLKDPSPFTRVSKKTTENSETARSTSATRV